jgi:hypothetical protein
MNPLNLSLQSIADAGINLDLADRDSLKDLVASVSSDIRKNSFSAIADKPQDSGLNPNTTSSQSVNPKSTEFPVYHLENFNPLFFSSFARPSSESTSSPESKITGLLKNFSSFQPGSKNNEPDADIFPAVDPQQIQLTNSTPSVSFALSNLSNTFLLHSNPFATKTIYLDFNGHILPAGSAWANGYNGGNAINAPAWSLDADTTTFSDAERSIIQGIWQRVAEDFAPFDVNVTTEDRGEAYLTRSSSSDQVYGTRALISPIGSYFGGGGIAYVGVFNYVGDNYKPALIFPENLANNEKYIAEAVTHEVGHNLGLDHDGTSTTGYYQGHGSGATGWASIMGVGYYQQLTQWSKGEYSGANNKEDDLSIITTNSGFGYRADEAGNTAVGAGNLGILGVNANNTSLSDINQFAIIQQTTDQDWFKFTTGNGSINLTIQDISQAFINNGGTFSAQYLTPASGITNLDIWAGIYGADGTTLVAQSNPVDLLSANFTNLFLNAGTYYLAIDGIGKGDPLTTGYSDYGSLGQYSISGTIVTPVTTAGISVNPISGLTTTESGGTATFSVVLNIAPTADVLIGVSSSNTNEGTVNVSNLTFTSANWNIAQNVTVTGVDDLLIDGNQTYSIVLAPATSSDANYNGLNPNDVTVVNNDNDLPLINITTSPQTVVEGLATSQVYTVSLSTASSQSITVQYATSNGTATSGSDYTSTTGTLTFNVGITTQTITIPILNNSVSEPDETFSLTLSNPTNALLGSTKSVTTTITDTLTASVTTTLSANVENLTLTGTAVIDGTGNVRANVIKGNSGNNVLKGGGGLDVLTGMGGNDTFDLTGIIASANRNTITDFLTGDTVRLSDNLTTRAGTGTPVFANVNQGSSVTLNTSTSDIFYFNFNNTESDVNLGTVTIGSALLDGLNAASASASLSTSASGGKGYILAYDNDNAYLYYFNAGSNKAVVATEINLINIFDSTSAIAVNSFVNTNFVMF